MKTGLTKSIKDLAEAILYGFCFVKKMQIHQHNINYDIRVITRSLKNKIKQIINFK